MKLLITLALLSAFSVAAAQQSAAPAPAPVQSSTPRITVAAVDASIQRASNWLHAQQQENGSFLPKVGRDICPVALTAMATWSLNEPEPRAIDAKDVERAVHFLLANRRPDGGIYDPAHGLAVYTSGVAARALRTLGARADWPEMTQALADVELFAYRRSAPESIVDTGHAGETPVGRSAEVAKSLLNDNAAKDDSKRKALEFLAHVERDAVRAPSRVRNMLPTRVAGQDGPFSYDDLLPFVYFDLTPEQQIAMRARAALHAYYTPDRNPDLTKRYGAAGFMPGTQGLFYYYFVVAKTLSVYGERTLVTADGLDHDWADEVATRLVRAQHDGGEWVNTDAGWWENEPVLATSYALLTLKLCRATLVATAAKR
jgi:hypothetical protein